MTYSVFKRPSGLALNPYIETVYKQHFLGLVSGKFTLEALPILFDKKLLDCSAYNPQGCNNRDYNCSNCFFKAKEDIFNHICTKEQTKTIRTPGLFDLLRTERICWIAKILSTYQKDSGIKYFTIPEKTNRQAHYLWLEAENYLVIVKQNKQCCFFATAYHVDFASEQRRLASKFARYKKSAGKPTP